MYKLTSSALFAAFILVVGCSAATARTTAATAATGIVINEILAHTDLPQQDAVELYNPTADAVDISGWLLADDKQAEQRYVIPARTVLAAGAYIVIILDEDAAFRLSEFGETVYLYQPDAGSGPGALVTRAEFGVSPNGVAFGPLTLSTGEVRQVLLQAVTLGSANAPPRVGPLVIDEVMYRPADGFAEYVAIRNASTSATPLCDLALTSLPARLQVDGDAAYDLPCALLLEPGERLFIARATPAEFRAQYGLSAAVPVVGPFSGRLSNEGERIEIVWPQPPETDGTVAYYALDQLDYAVTAPWPIIATDGLGLHRRDASAFGDDPVQWNAGVSSLVAARVWLPWVGS